MSIREEIGAYEAKTHLPAYLRKVKAGGRFVITQHGRPVAELIPVGNRVRIDAGAAASRMRAFMQRQVPGKGIDIKALLEEGRD